MFTKSKGIFNLDLIKETIKKHEGLVLFAYECSEGKTSLGYGRNLDDTGITEEEANYLLDNDVDKVIDNLDEYWPVWRDMPVQAQAVCIDMTFQMGITGFMNFRRTRALMEMGDFVGASEECLRSKWAEQTPSRANYNSRQLYLCQKKPTTKKTTHKD
tara:strand:+ start:3716 stop:4189 length:474 start_codon:yes stop_codon:yes gene_type:complete